STAPALDVLVAAAMTWAAHSSVAVVLLTMSLAAKGVVPPDAAIALVAGANLGSAVNPLLEGAPNGDAAGKRLAMGNLINRAVGVALTLALLGPIGSALVRLEPDDARAVADFHTAFNLALACLFFPFLAPFAALLRRLLPARVEPVDPSAPLYLDAAAKETPIVALGAAAREALRVADALEAMLAGARDAIVSGDRRRIADVRRSDDVIDRLNSAIKSYLTSLDHAALSDSDSRRVEQILAFTMNVEQAGDVVDRTLLPRAAKRLKRGLTFAKEDEAELVATMDRLIANLRAAASLFMTEDPRAARRLADEKPFFRDAEASAMRAHLERLRSGRTEPSEPSALRLDLLRDMKLVNSHLVAAAAYPVLERSGALLPTRIAGEGAADTSAGAEE
ncbi:MAG: Na/Pi cotransporter family protein, partial [Hyphomicrobiales bacterium]|nr:Na/Pi cotransporter family protein [Hyphomicrobiales bacterium]